MEKFAQSQRKQGAQPPPPEPIGYEEHLGPVRRRIARVARQCLWLAKGLARRPRCILVETRWRLGDEIMALPVLEALRARYPNNRIAVWSNYPDLFAECPSVDAVIGPDRAPPPPAPDRYILLRGAPRDVVRIDHYARRAGIPTPSQRPRLAYSNWAAAPLAEIQALAPTRVALSPGASWPTKRWPMARWMALAKALESAGCGVFDLGHGCEPTGARVSLVDRTSVRDAACALHAADLFIGSDSGLMHLALAVGTRVLALFGPTDPRILIQNEPNLTVIRAARECAGCWNAPSPAIEPGSCPQGEACCLDTITVEDVVQRAMHLLGLER